MKSIATSTYARLAYCVMKLVVSSHQFPCSTNLSIFFLRKLSTLFDKVVSCNHLGLVASGIGGGSSLACPCTPTLFGGGGGAGFFPGLPGFVEGVGTLLCCVVVIPPTLLEMPYSLFNEFAPCQPVAT